MYQSSTSLLCFSLCTENGIHSSGFSRGKLFVTFRLADAAPVTGSPGLCESCQWLQAVLSAQTPWCVWLPGQQAAMNSDRSGRHTPVNTPSRCFCPLAPEVTALQVKLHCPPFSCSVVVLTNPVFTYRVLVFTVTASQLTKLKILLLATIYIYREREREGESLQLNCSVHP